MQDYTEIVRRGGQSKARIRQLADPTLLAPDIQDRILSLTTTGGERFSERTLRRVAAPRSWDDQRAAFAIAHPQSDTKSR